MTGSPTLPSQRVDLVVVGAGVVGLGHAVQALAYGWSVVVVERDEVATGASVRNFGHGCFTAQDGTALTYARRAREVWLHLAQAADFWLSRAGTVVVARHDDELAVLEDFAAARGDDVVMLDTTDVRSRVPVGTDVIGGAWLPGDIRIDPRQAIPAIRDWLVRQGVQFMSSTSLLEVEEDGVRTSRGRVDARHVVVAVGHDVDQLFPQIAEDAGITRCSLHMLRVVNPTAAIEPAVLTGWSLLRYGGFAISPALEAVRERLDREVPGALEAGLHLMLTQRPDGDLVIGDTHTYAATASPFRGEDLDDLVLDQVASLLGTPRPRVLERWQGVYASAAQPFLVAEPSPTTRVVSVTAGIGMTTAFGLSADVIDALAA